jgi:hypothetical protein
MSGPLETVHTFQPKKQEDGSWMLNVFRRVDTHEIKLVAILALIGDKEHDAEQVGRELCAVLNRELETRGKSA